MLPAAKKRMIKATSVIEDAGLMDHITIQCTVSTVSRVRIIYIFCQSVQRLVTWQSWDQYLLQITIFTHNTQWNMFRRLPRKTNIDHPVLSLTMFQRNFKQILFLDSIKTPAVFIQSLNNSHQSEWALRIAILKETFHKVVIQN